MSDTMNLLIQLNYNKKLNINDCVLDIYDDRDRIKCQWNRLFSKGDYLIIDKFGGKSHYEINFKLYPEDNNIGFIYIENIESTLLLHILDETADNVLYIDNNHNVIYMNQSQYNNYVEIYGTQIQLGYPIYDFIKDETDKTSLHEMWTRALKKEKFQVNMIFQEIYFNVSFGYIESNRNIKAFAISRNIQSEHLLNLELVNAKNEAIISKEDSIKANESKSLQLQRMSHELRTPLNTIIGFSQLIKKSISEDLIYIPNNTISSPLNDIPEYINHVHKSSLYLLSMVNNILDIASLESNKLNIFLEPISCYKILRESITLMNFMAVEYNNTKIILNKFPKKLYILADKYRLLHIFNNIISNAIKYNRLENPKIYIKTWISDSNKLVVCIKDRGIGIDPEQLQYLYTDFNRLGIESRKNVPGTGIGLSLSRRLILAMNGSIKIKSKVNIGTIVYLEFNLSMKRSRNSNHVSTKTKTLPTKFILYIEDNAISTNLMKCILKAYKHIKLLSAIQGTIGIELAKAYKPNIIFIDLGLPDMSGENILLNLKCDDNTRSIPVIAVSSDNNDYIKNKMMENGCEKFIEKPINIEEIIDIISEYGII